MRGILLAGGTGSRLAPLTRTVSKQLLPVYDKPVIYYPLSVLMLAGIRDILVISTPRDVPLIRGLLGDGRKLGLRLAYAVQSEPRGIAEALIIAEEFLAGKPVCMILGDNIFYGHELPRLLTKATQLQKGARTFAYQVQDPQRFGVLELDQEHRVLSIEEKPKTPKSSWVATGLYCFDGEASRLARSLKPSARGELEITDLNRLYLQREQLQAIRLGRGFAWLDAGTFDSLLASSIFVQTLEHRTGLKIACIEEIALRQGLIDRPAFQRLIDEAEANEYTHYLRRVLEEIEAERAP